MIGTAKRLIDADRLEKLVEKHRATYLFKEDVLAAIAKQPVVDAVEVVRCMDCNKEGTENCPMVHKDKLIGNLWAETKSTDFCSYGERRTEEDET